MGYEGRYRRTLSPSGLGSKSGDQTTRSMSTETPNGRLDSTLSPSGIFTNGKLFYSGFSLCFFIFKGLVERHTIELYHDAIAPSFMWHKIDCHL